MKKKKDIEDVNNNDKLYTQIVSIISNAKLSTLRSINNLMVQTYWSIGKLIIEEEQNGKERADYGLFLIKDLSKRLTKEFGPGFNEPNLRNMRQFFMMFQIRSALRSELSWTHYRLLMRIENENARNFYLNEVISNNWSTRELERQINSLLFERISMSKDKKKIRELAIKGQKIETPEDAIKDPYILEFLGLKENIDYLEKDLEKGLIKKLKDFLLELGKGFSFVARQKRITVDGDHYYIDLVFYNYILKCFFLIDLKIGKLTHQDIGQMDFYVRYFEKEIKQVGDNPTIGLILCSDKNEVMVKYTSLSENKNIFASKYKLYLPSEEELKREVEKDKQFLLRELDAKYGESK